MKIYADICTLCRPFDDQSQPRVWLETHALCVILNLVELGHIQMVRSPVQDLEISRNPWPLRRLWEEQCLTLAHENAPLSPAQKQRALQLEALGMGAMDALHAASAETASYTHLLTCDDRFRKRYRGPLTVLNPAGFVIACFQQSP